MCLYNQQSTINNQQSTINTDPHTYLYISHVTHTHTHTNLKNTGEVNLTEARAPSKYNVHFLEHKDKLPPVDSRQKNLSHVAMSEEDRESLPKQYRYTTLETTLADALIAAHAEDFKGAMFSSLTDLVNTLRPKARARCDKWAAG